ncbi:MAG TPA: hypothetical protein VFV57_12390 [Limnobacter sp.]|nr:hypothetical protein [Limnobacter sp.]
MNFQTSEVATVSSIEGRVFVIREGVETPLKQDMALRAGDVLRSTENSMAVLSIPGTQQQIPAFLEVANGGIAQLEFDPDLGNDGQVVVTSGTNTADGTVTLVSDMEGENQAAVLEGQDGQGDSFGLFGAGLAAGGGAFLPAAGAVGAAAILAGGDNESNAGGGTPGAPTSPTDNLGGLAETVGNLTNNLGEITNPIPVVDDVVDSVGGAVTDLLAGTSGDTLGGLLATVGTVTDSLADMAAPVPVLGDVLGGVGTLLDSVLTGNNNGGVSGLLTGLGDGFENALLGTPAEAFGDGANTVLGTVGGVLSGVGDSIASVGTGTPLEAVTGLLGDVVGTTDGGGLLGGIPVLDDLLSPLTDGLGALPTSIGSNATGDGGGLLGGGLLSGLQDLTNTLG